MKLNRNFYKRDSLIVAKELLGCILVHSVNGKVITGKIVETEAYRGPEDKAAHSYNNRRTERTEVMFGEAGRSYVYFIYGIHNCMNVVCGEVGLPHAVLIRALEPLKGIEYMSLNRYNSSSVDISIKKQINLCNGPGKLCKALEIDRSLNGVDLCGDVLFITKGELVSEEDIKASKRVGIDYAEEAKDYLWRFYIKDNKYISKK